MSKRTTSAGFKRHLAAAWHGCFPGNLRIAQLLLALLCIAINPANARAPTPPESPGEVISAAELPPQAHVVLRAIKMGGPFPYAKDGSVFSNRERRLPRKPYGYYREYTVPTPGAKDRGPRRIIAGGNQDFYYTDDHYRRFKRIAE
jgi:ribonuclease T1